ncbi:MAG: hypothetical protein COA85_02320 [Robiginitomaculum sp.]|nr:MAG: hypothetical protein COA85_02320 [Robiginitomaculum sp.]
MTALATVGSSIAVFITLIYLSGQVRSANKQRELEAYRHTSDTLNAFCDLMSESEERARIVLKGRMDRARLSEAEKMVFDHIHIRLLNGLESWHHHLEQTMRAGAFCEKQISNIKTIITLYFDFPGTHGFWEEIRPAFAPIQPLIDEALSGTERHAP